MFHALTSRYGFACPERGEARVSLSSFRRIAQLPGAEHPAVFQVDFDCGCGGRHPGLVSHDELDWAPLGLQEEGVFLNLMTATLDPVDGELADLAATRIKAGERSALGIAVRCPVCSSVSVNLVSAQHLDVPFHNDEEIGVVEHVFALDAERAVEEFSADLHSARFDARRLLL